MPADIIEYLQECGFSKDGGGVWIKDGKPLRFKQFAEGNWMILWEQPHQRTSLGEFEQLTMAMVYDLWRILIKTE